MTSVMDLATTKAHRLNASCGPARSFCVLGAPSSSTKKGRAVNGVNDPAGERQHCPYLPLIWKDVPELLAAFQGPILRKLNRLERIMSALTDVLADLDTATNEVAAKIDAQTASIADLAAQLAAAQAGSQEAADLRAQIDSAVAAIGAESARLHGLAADPENPVPDAPVEDAPAE
jgi:hypothetical protein